jgi:hypothetical protein
MAKKVLQTKTRRGWDRLSAEDIRNFLSYVYPSWSGGRLRQGVRLLFSRRDDLGIRIRFDKLSKCRERSYKGFTETEEYYRMIEEEALFV